MDAEATPPPPPPLPPPPPSPPAGGLPPVTPPSGRFIAQLFLVPGAIVLVAVLLLMMFHSLFGGSQTVPQILRNLDSANPDIRWRAASDLANTLEKPESQALRCDPQFALELVERLRQAIDEVVGTKAAADKEGRRLNPEIERQQQNFVSFLTVAVGRMRVPLAIRVLSELVQRKDRPDDVSFVRIRRQALLALSLLGDNVQTFPDLPEEERAKILNSLEQLAGGKDLSRSAWARTALFYLDKPRLQRITSDMSEVVRVDQALAVCATADDPFTRLEVALCLRFWDGDLVESTLVQLAHDDGHGTVVKGD